MKNIAVVIGLVGLFSISGFGQKDVAEKYAKTITPEELHGHLEILASDEYEGRETGTKGQKMAMKYIVDFYKELGIKPSVGEEYVQHYPLKKESSVGSEMDINGKKYDFIDDFYFFPGFDAQRIVAKDILFLGYGIESDNYNDYNGVDVKGKTILILEGEPYDKKGNSIVTGTKENSKWSEDWRKKRVLAMEKGAANLLIVKSEYDNYISRVRYYLETPMMGLDYKEKRGEDIIPVIFVKNTIMYDLFSAKETVKTIKKITKKKQPISMLAEKVAVINIVRKKEHLEAENVLCFIEGTDSLLKNEIVVISAHYDHLGIIDGVVYNGADDDGSGTVATLEIAEAFVKAKKEGNGTRRSILILNVSGEEKGLLGSEWYSEFPIYPLENTVCNLNIDMIGRVDEQHKDDDKYVYIIGSDKLSTELHSISEEVNNKYTKLAYDYTYNDPKDPNRFYYRSDHYNFAKNGIPVIFYFSGVHEDYHQPGDDVEKILFEKTATIAQLVFYTAWEVANRDKKLVVDVESDFE